MAIDYNALAIPKGPSRFERAKVKDLSAKKQEREVFALVTTRDESCCRVCGKWCNPRAIGLLQKAHHHHLVYRSRGGEDTTANVCLLCADCHEDEHAGRLQLSGDADERDPAGRLCGVKVEKPIEGGFEVIAWT